MMDLELKREIILKECEQIASTIPLKYSDMILHNEKIFLLPGIAEKIFVYDLEQKKEQVLEYLHGYLYRRSDNEGGMFYSNQKVGNALFLFPYCSNGILKLNLDSEEQNLEKICIERKLYLEVLKEEFVKNKFKYESPNVDLWKYIECVKKINEENELNQKNIGAKIMVETKDSTNERGI